MKNNYNIRLINKAELDVILPLLQLLNPSENQTVLEERLTQIKETNYKCVGVFDGDTVIGISGLWILYKMYVGKHVELDNVCILPQYRGQGIGELLMLWIFNYAKSLGCNSAELNCHLENIGGQKFWKEHGFETIGYHFIKKIKQ